MSVLMSRKCCSNKNIQVSSKVDEIFIVNCATFTVEGGQNILFPENNKYFIIYRESKNDKYSELYVRKYIKYFVSRINDIKFHNNVSSVLRSRLHVKAHVRFFDFHR